MPNTYTINPLTGRQIRIGGDVFNRLIMGSHDFISGRLVRRQNVPPPQEVPQYLNTMSGRMVQHGSRTYFRLIEADCEIIDDYYIVDFEEEELIDTIYREIRRREPRGAQRLTFNEIENMREDIESRRLADQDSFDDFMLRQELFNDLHRAPRTTRSPSLEDYAPRLAELNVALCQECLMPENPNELTDGLCKDCK